MFHEASHIVDCVVRITPFLDDSTEMINKYEKEEIRITPFVKDVWEDINLPVHGNDFPFRDMITFYGLNGGPKIKISDAKSVYEGLSKTVFVSLYSGKSWAEDSAEFAAFSHLVRYMKQPYRITLVDGKKEFFSYEPMKNAAVAYRYTYFDSFYHEIVVDPMARQKQN
jgi:hypothetical protein